MRPKVLVTGSTGQIGSELLPVLRARYGHEQVVAGTHRARPAEGEGGPCEAFDVADFSALSRVVKEHRIDTIYHLAAVLSATGEKDPDSAWQVNVQGLKNVLNASRDLGVARVFWPSSIAVFGPDVPRVRTPQTAPLNPVTMYGVTKVAGELLCNYYYLKYGLDTRCLRYPGLVSSETMPGGGTTDYAVEIFYAAIRGMPYSCFVRGDTVLPMMYMPDAIKAAVDVMEAEPSRVPRHSGYNLGAISFSASELAGEILQHVPDFRVSYSPDSRQKIADSWPMSVDDSEARAEWGWAHTYDLKRMTKDMIMKLRQKSGLSQNNG